MHLLGNMVYLWMFGDNVEDVLGGLGYLLVYLACGFAANAAQYLLNPASTIPCVGASGAISGVMGLYLVFFRYAYVDVVISGRSSSYTYHTSSFGAVGSWLGFQLFMMTLARMAGTKGGVAYGAHVGGLAAGLGMGGLFYLFGLRASKPPRPLYFKRDEAADVWCPYCGAMYAPPFGDFTCSRCQTTFDIAKKLPEPIAKARQIHLAIGLFAGLALLFYYLWRTHWVGNL